MARDGVGFVHWNNVAKSHARITKVFELLHESVLDLVRSQRLHSKRSAESLQNNWQQKAKAPFDYLSPALQEMNLATCAILQQNTMLDSSNSAN